MNFERLNKNQVATAFGVDPRTIHRWCGEGFPRSDDGTFPLADCIAWFGERARNKGAPPPAPEPPEALDWLVEFRKERALRAKLEREEIEAQLLKRGDVLQGWLNRYSHFRRHLLTWSKRLPGRIVGLTERETLELIDEEVRFLLGLLSRPGKFTHPDQGDIDAA
jgi:hypothetical protein